MIKMKFDCTTSPRVKLITLIISMVLSILAIQVLIHVGLLMFLISAGCLTVLVCYFTFDYPLRSKSRMERFIFAILLQSKIYSSQIFRLFPE